MTESSLRTIHRCSPQSTVVDANSCLFLPESGKRHVATLVLVSHCPYVPPLVFDEIAQYGDDNSTCSCVLQNIVDTTQSIFESRFRIILATILQIQIQFRNQIAPSAALSFYPSLLKLNPVQSACTPRVWTTTIKSIPSYIQRAKLTTEPRPRLATTYTYVTY